MSVVDISNTFQMSKSGEHIDNTDVYNSNRNLLDNPWFTVNQRGYTSNNLLQLQYWADRWLRNTSTNGQGSLSLSNGVVTLTAPSGSGAFGNILQKMADPSIINGKTVTLSLLKSDGTIISGSFVRTMGTAQTAYNSNNVKLLISASNTVAVQVENGASISFRAVKLELGSYSTLANDVPPDYKTELDKCQYYYRELKAIAATYLAQGVSVAGTNFRVILPYTMRTRPTVTYSGTLTAYYSGGNAPVTAISVAGTISDAVQLSFTTSGISGANQPVSLDAAAGAKICLSADL